MRQFIREHPWRLEIMPTAIIIYTLFAPVLFSPAFHKAGDGWHGFSLYQIRLIEWLAILVTMLSVRLVGIHLNHALVHVEAAKRYWRSMLTVTAMGFGGASFFPQLGLAPAMGYMGLFLAAIPIQLALEKSLPFIPHTTLHEDSSPPPRIRAGDSFYYSERRTRWVPFTVVPALGAVSFMYAWVLSGRWWVGAVLAFLPLPLLRAAQEKYIVTKDRIFVQIAFSRVSIPISDIAECLVADYDWIAEDERTPSEGPTVGCFVSDVTSKGPYVTVRTAAGKTYVLGFRRAATACALINAAIAARGESVEKHQDL